MDIQALLDNVLTHISKVSKDEIKAKSKQMKNQLLEYLKKFSEDPEVEKIDKAFRNILNSKVPHKNTNKCLLFQKNICDIFSAIEIFTNLMNQLSNISSESLDIERKLFSISFNPSDDNNLTYILPVFLKQFDFLTTNSFFVKLECSTGSGKTRVTPFIFSIKSFCNKLKQPFIFMIQPRYSIISEKIKDFKNILGDSVHIISNQNEFEKFYGKKLKKNLFWHFLHQE